MSELKREDFFSDDLIEAPLILASNMEKALAVARKIIDEMSKLSQNVKGSKSITELNDATRNLVSTQREFDKLQQQMQQAQERTSQAYIDQADAVARLKEQQKKAADQSKLSRQINEAQDGSIRKLELQLKKNRLAYEQMSKAERENTDAGRQLLKTIQEQDGEYKKLKTSIGQNQANVGNYTQSIIQALTPIRGLSGGLGNLASGFTGNIGAMSGFGMAMKSIPIFAIISAITSLVSYFTKTEEGALKLKIVMAAISAIFDTLTDYIIDAGKALSELTLDKVKEQFQELGDSIRDYVLERIDIFLRGIKGLGEAFSLLFKGKFKEAANTAGKAVIDLLRTATPLGVLIDAQTTIVKKLGDVATKVYDDISDRVERAVEAQKSENALLVEKRKFLIREAELNVEIAEQKEIASDATLRDIEKLEALKKAEESINELYTNRIRLKQEENRIAQIRDDLAANDIAANDAAAQREAELIQLRADAARERKGVTKQISVLEKKIAEDTRQQEIAGIKKTNEIAIAAVQERINQEVVMIQQASLRGEITKAEAEKRINAVRKNLLDDYIAAQIEGLKKVLEYNKLLPEERDEINKKLTELQMQYNDALFQQLEDQPEQVKKNWKETLEEIAAIAQDAISRIGDLFKSASERRIAALDAEIAKIDENAKRELALAGENEEAKRLIQQRAEADRLKIEAKRKQERQRAARIEKAAAIIDATIATAVAVTKVLANIPLALLVAALGAAQIATIARQPIPQFAEGTRSAPGGLAVVGEKGTELVRERSGQTYFTPSTPSVMNIPRGAEVIPHDRTMAGLATIAMAGGRQGLQDEIESLKNVIINSDKRIVDAIFRTSPDLIRQGSMLYAVRRDAEKNKVLVRKSIFG